MRAKAWTLAAAAVVLPVQMAAAQSNIGCEMIQRSAQEGMALRVAADDEQIAMPQSVMQLTCMDFFYNGNIFNVLIDFEGALIGFLTQAAFQAACGLARQAWDATIGQIQCGITITGMSIGFGGSLAGGSFCPNVVIGGNGPVLAGASLQAGAVNNPYFGYAPEPMPTGYPLGIPFGRQR